MTPPDVLTGRSLLVAASYVVLRRGDEVLLQLRRDTGYMDGFWASLAGHVDPYESAQEAAVREAREGAGVTIDAGDLRALTTLHRVEVGGPPVEQRCDFFFEVTRWAGEPTVLEPTKCAAMQWFDLDALPADVVPHERLVLDGLRSGDLPPVVSLLR
ncbi:NUDIX domain-containing protein [Kineosporia sp. A_224]|uniref:NUDIX hydrolase n=1 Tax=Kineosporia sp. A_224 TaxID=1962180 RepID=UPI000B4B1136|nr:NUDIX domain-containing protein [Kineosporia sp. A_224]